MKYTAGRELDKLVAELFYKQDIAEYTFAGHNYYKRGHINPIPNYSTSKKEAMQLWVDFVETHQWCCTELWADYTYVWGAKVTAYFRTNQEHATTVDVYGENLAEVICNAVVQSVEWLNDRI